MEPFVVTTPRLELRLKTPVEVLAWVDSLPPEVRVEVSPAWVERARAATAGDVWVLSFTVTERSSGVEVGGCAFKGPPDADGMVEVAYGIDEPHQRKGYASELTEALVALAFGRGVRVVRAHTKPDNVASLRVLEKCRFRPLGTVIDPEDGEVLRFERTPVLQGGSSQPSPLPAGEGAASASHEPGVGLVRAPHPRRLASLGRRPLPSGEGWV